MSERPHVVELEFRFDGTDLALGRAAAAAEAELEVELVVPRSDGTVLAFVDVSSGTATVVDELAAEPTVASVSPLDRPGTGGLLEIVMDGHPVTTLADRGAVVTHVAVDPTWGRVVADVPPAVEASTVIAAFTLAHPSARLVARRRTDRGTPLTGQSQFVTCTLSRFTERQLHALRVAHDAGYFEWPRESTAGEVAEQIGVSTPTFSQHLRAAERKLTALLFEG